MRPLTDHELASAAVVFPVEQHAGRGAAAAGRRGPLRDPDVLEAAGPPDAAVTDRPRSWPRTSACNGCRVGGHPRRRCPIPTCSRSSISCKESAGGAAAGGAAALRDDPGRGPQRARPYRPRLHLDEQDAGRVLRRSIRARAGLRNSSLFWQRYRLTDDRRGGVLTMAAPLLATSLANSHQSREARQVGAGDAARRAAASAAWPTCPTSTTRRRRRTQLSFRERLERHRGRSDLRLVPSPDGPARLRPGELRRHRRLAREGRPAGRSTRPGTLPDGTRFHGADRS